MSWFCSDVPEYLIVSTIDVVARHGNYGSHVLHKAKMPWTRKLEDLAASMRDDGETWLAIAQELEDRTGVRLSARAVQDRIERG